MSFSSTSSNGLLSNNLGDHLIDDELPFKYIDDPDFPAEVSNVFTLADEKTKVLASVFARPDLILIVENTRLYVRKEQLEDISPVFTKMFQAVNMVNERRTHMAEKELLGISLKQLVEFLRCALPGIDEEVKEDTIFSIMQLAAEYAVNRCLAKVDKFLANKSKLFGDLISSDQVVINVLQAEEHNLPLFLETCIEIASRKCYSHIMDHPKFEDVSMTTKLKISNMHWKCVDAIIQSNGYLEEETRSVDFNQPCSSISSELIPPPNSGSTLVDHLRQFMRNN